MTGFKRLRVLQNCIVQIQQESSKAASREDHVSTDEYREGGLGDVLWRRCAEFGLTGVRDMTQAGGRMSLPQRKEDGLTNCDKQIKIGVTRVALAANCHVMCLGVVFAKQEL